MVGAGPNGLTAAITLAEAGVPVRVYEARDEVGGGATTAELTLPGFRHDVCSAVHPLGAGSPAFARYPLQRFGLDWVHPEVAMAHPFHTGETAVLTRSVDVTADSLGIDAPAYRRLVGSLSPRWWELAPDLLRAPLLAPPRHPALLARFGLPAAMPAAVLARTFRGPRARGLLAGLAAHVMTPLSAPGTGGVAMLFALAAHAVGWPFPRGGSQALSHALVAYLREMGGEVVTGTRVWSWKQLPPARAYLFDLSPTALAALAGSRLPPHYMRRLHRYRYGPGVFKVDYALDGPVPWTNPECLKAGTVHLGASIREIGTALSDVHRGRVPDPPFLITAQPSVFDRSRAPEGDHVFWVYAHVPHAWQGDLTAAIEKRIERFAPGFRDRMLARAVQTPATLETRNPNYVGGDIGCGTFAGSQTVFRPTVARIPYATPNPAIYLCSAATPPGPGVHGMCGYHAALVALRRHFGTRRQDGREGSS